MEHAISSMLQASYRSNLGSTSRRAMEIAAAMELPPGYAIRTSGTAALMDEVFGDLELVLLLALLLVYLVMAAQFESLLHPLIIILAVPLAFTGASRRCCSPERASACRRSSGRWCSRASWSTAVLS